MKKLSDTQKKVLDNMEYDKWYCAYELRASMATLNSLVNKNICKVKGRGSLGSTFSPRTIIYFQKIKGE